MKRALWPFLLICLVVMLSYGRVVEMYYWVDDWSLLYKMVHPESAPGNLGAGVFGEGPYRYLATPFILVYPLFGLTAWPYFAIGVLHYLLVALLVYVLVKELTGSRLVGLTSGVIFGSGYIGSMAMYRISNSWQLSGAAFFMVVSFYLLIKHFRTGRWIYLFGSIVTYLVLLEFYFLRSHGAIAIVGAVLLFFYPRSRKLRDWLTFGVKVLPLIVIFYFMYFGNFLRGIDANGGTAKKYLSELVSTVIQQRHFELFNNVLATFGNVVVPNPLTKSLLELLDSLAVMYSLNSLAKFDYLYPVVWLILIFGGVAIIVRDKLSRLIALMVILSGLLLAVFERWSLKQHSVYWNASNQDVAVATLGGSLIIGSIGLYWLCRKEFRLELALIVLGVIWIIANTFIYFVYNPTVFLDSNQRYLIPAFVGSSFIWGGFIYILSKLLLKRSVHQLMLSLGLVVLVSVTFVMLSRSEQAEVITSISRPTRLTYQQIKAEVPKIDDKSVFLVEMFDDPKLRGFPLGGMGNLGIPLMYNYYGEAKVVDTYDDIFYLLDHQRTSLDNVYTFYLDRDHVVSTSTQFRKQMSQVNQPEELRKWRVNTPASGSGDLITTSSEVFRNGQGAVGVNPKLEATLNFSSLTPAVLTLEMSVKPLPTSQLAFPYSDVSSLFDWSVNKINLEQTPPKDIWGVYTADYLATLALEQDRRDFVKSVEATASSNMRGQEVGYAVDGDDQTAWRAGALNWNYDYRPEEIVLDFRSTRTFNKIIWTNHHPSNTPTDYKYFTSDDGHNWLKLAEFKPGSTQPPGFVNIDTVPVTTSRYLKMSIFDTYMGSGYPPAIREVWTTNLPVFLSIDQAKRIVDCPFCYVPDERVADQASSLISRMSVAKLEWTTDRRPSYFADYTTHFNLIMDGQTHLYNIYLPAQGTVYRKLRLSGLAVPVELTLKSSTIRSLNFSELKELGLIHQYDESLIRR